MIVRDVTRNNMMNVQRFVVWAWLKATLLASFVTCPYFLHSLLPKGGGVKSFTSALKVIINPIAAIPFNLASATAKTAAGFFHRLPTVPTRRFWFAPRFTRTAHRAKLGTVRPLVVKFFAALLTLFERSRLFVFPVAFSRAKFGLRHPLFHRCRLSFVKHFITLDAFFGEHSATFLKNGDPFGLAVLLSSNIHLSPQGSYKQKKTASVD